MSNKELRRPATDDKATLMNADWNAAKNIARAKA